MNIMLFIVSTTVHILGNILNISATVKPTFSWIFGVN